MFMRNNRAKNGAPQPEKTLSDDAAGARSARKLDPNQPVGSPEDWRFTPDLSTCDAINNAHVHAGVSGVPFLTNYQGHIPFVGQEAEGAGSGDRKLKDSH